MWNSTTVFFINMPEPLLIGTRPSHDLWKGNTIGRWTAKFCPSSGLTQKGHTASYVGCTGYRLDSSPCRAPLCRKALNGTQVLFPWDQVGPVSGQEQAWLTNEMKKSAGDFLSKRKIQEEKSFLLVPTFECNHVIAPCSWFFWSLYNHEWKTKRLHPELWHQLLTETMLERSYSWTSIWEKPLFV